MWESFLRIDTTSTLLHTSGMYASSNMRWMSSRRRLLKIVSGSSGIHGVPVVSSSGVASFIHSAAIPSMPGVLRLHELNSVSAISGQKIGSFHSKYRFDARYFCGILVPIDWVLAVPSCVFMQLCPVVCPGLIH